MHIGIDAHVVGTKAGGNETYMRQLLSALAAHAADARVTAFVNYGVAEDAVFGGACPAFRTYRLPVRSSYLRVPFALPLAARRASVDVLHVQYTAPPYCPCPFVVSMHDIVALRFPESMPFADRHRLRLLSRGTLRRAARVFVLTKAIRDEIAGTYGISVDRFDLVQPPADPAFRPVPGAEAKQRVGERYGIDGPFVLYMGLLQPRKNLVRLARAFARLEDAGLDHRLVIAGKRAWLYGDMLREIEELGLGDRLVFTDYVEPEDLPYLYNAASAFAYVSLYEGFGIPVLEALGCGTPVLASTDPALVEVGGGAAVHVDPFDVDAIEDGLRRILTDSVLRDKLRAAGPERAGHFTAEAMAHAAAQGYTRATDH